MIRKKKSNNEVGNLPNTQYLNYSGLLLIFLYSSTMRFRFSFMSSGILLFALLIVNLAGISGPSYLQIFRVFLNTGNFAFHMSTLFEEKV